MIRLTFQDAVTKAQLFQATGATLVPRQGETVMLPATPQPSVEHFCLEYRVRAVHHDFCDQVPGGTPDMRVHRVLIDVDPT